MALLETKDLTMQFGGLVAVANLNIHLERGELVGLIGPNGAGKTTVFNMLTGFYQPTGGDILWRGQSVAGLKPYQVTNMGIARTFQNIRLFGNLSVLDNVRTAYHSRCEYSLFTAVARFPAFRREEERISREALRLLEIFDLKHRMHDMASSLPYGEQRRLEIARALATNPELLLLDEPAAGMNPQETVQLADWIRWIKEEFDLTILLIEHDMNLVMRLCERIYVLDYGVMIAHGSPEEVRTDERVIEAYLGEEAV